MPSHLAPSWAALLLLSGSFRPRTSSSLGSSGSFGISGSQLRFSRHPLTSLRLINSLSPLDSPSHLSSPHPPESLSCPDSLSLVGEESLLQHGVQSPEWDISFNGSTTVYWMEHTPAFWWKPWAMVRSSPIPSVHMASHNLQFPSRTCSKDWRLHPTQDSLKPSESGPWYRITNPKKRNTPVFSVQT